MVMNHERLNGMIPLEVLATILKNGWFLLEDDFYPPYKKNGETRKPTYKKSGGQGLPGILQFPPISLQGGPLPVINGVITPINGRK